MTHLPATIFAYFLNSIAVLIDKFLLTDEIPNPIVYVFYFSAFSLIVLGLLPFIPPPPIWVFILASISTLSWTTGAFFMFTALKQGQASRVIPVIGTLIPLILLFFYGNLAHSISYNEIWASAFLTLGLVVLIFPFLKGRILAYELFLEIVSSVLFAASYIILKQAYTGGPFLSVLVYSRLILIPVGLMLLSFKHTRHLIFGVRGKKIVLFSKFGLLFLFGQVAGGSAELLLLYSISLANPSLVNSLQGVQYVFLFIFSLILGRKLPKIFQEKLNLGNIVSKLLGIVLIFMGLLILGLSSSKKALSLEFGVSFSPRYASELKLDPKVSYTKILNELKIKSVRIPLYWDEVEPLKNYYDFVDVDFYLSEAAKKGVKVMLVLGYKQPRWPECFEPIWSKSLSQAEKSSQVLKLITAEVIYFKTYNNIDSWQLENEPLLPFGICSIDPTYRGQLLKEELKLVKSLDSRPVIITDSGELSTWRNTYPLGDKLGITLYRQVWSPYFGLVDYPLFPLFYKLKGEINSLLHHSKKEIVVSELQAEPWPDTAISLSQLPLDTQVKLLPLPKLQANIEYARETGFSKFYLWGAEWWLFMEKNNHPEYMDYIKSLMNP